MKEGWTYGYSEALRMDFAYRLKDGKLETYTEDKVYYNEREVKAIAAHKDGITPQVHIIKKLFKGEIII